MYRGWHRGLPEHVEVTAVSLPGRESLLRETPIPDLARLADAVAARIESALDRPYALFGHSMGAWLAYELACRQRRAGLPQPAHLFVSSRRAPMLPDTEPPLHSLDDDALVAEIQRRYGGIPEAVLRERELLALLLPALRADLQALEGYRWPNEEPLPCPVSCYGGLADALVDEASLVAWKRTTATQFEIELFPGRHFYLLEESAADVLERVSSRLEG
jgi:surfactin synthase thioesterase subunit